MHTENLTFFGLHFAEDLEVDGHLTFVPPDLVSTVEEFIL